MHSVCDTLAGGFPHSDIYRSQPGYRLPVAFRRFQRLSSPLDAKSSTVCPLWFDQPDQAPIRDSLLNFRLGVSLASVRVRIAMTALLCRGIRTANHLVNIEMTPFRRIYEITRSYSLHSLPSGSEPDASVSARCHSVVKEAESVRTSPWILLASVIRRGDARPPI